jgi:hypothetical protein
MGLMIFVSHMFAVVNMGAQGVVPYFTSSQILLVPFVTLPRLVPYISSVP